VADVAAQRWQEPHRRAQGARDPLVAKIAFSEVFCVKVVSSEIVHVVSRKNLVDWGFFCKIMHVRMGSPLWATARLAGYAHSCFRMGRCGCWADWLPSAFSSFFKSVL
jgi:hypothetical protein